MWSLKITTEQRYKFFEPILPDIRTDIQLFFDCYYSKINTLEKIEEDTFRIEYMGKTWIRKYFKSFIIERTLDNQYQITFYE